MNGLSLTVVKTSLYRVSIVCLLYQTKNNLDKIKDIITPLVFSKISSFPRLLMFTCVYSYIQRDFSNTHTFNMMLAHFNHSHIKSSILKPKDILKTLLHYLPVL